MTDLISRADAIEAVCEDWCGYPYSKCPHKPQRMCDGCDTIEVLRALPSAEAVDAEKLKSMKFVTIKGDKVEEAYRTGWNGAIDCVIGEYASAEAENPKVVGINDADRTKVGGIYQTAAPSAEAAQGEWVRKVKEYNDCDGHRFVYWYECDQCGARPPKDQWKNEWHSNFCPSCGAKMYKGGDTE